MVRDIGFLVYPGFHILDLTGPVAVFEELEYAPQVPPPYRLRMLSAEGGLVASSSGVAVMTEPFGEPAFDTFVVVGGAGTLATMESPGVLDFVRAAAAGSRRVASICSGAGILAAAGLLDGRRATTHWRFAADLQRRYPRVRIDEERIFIQDGPIWTSAGVSAGIDLSLALVEEDLGLEASRARARTLVVYHRRPGGQSQFSTLLELEPPSDRIRHALTFAREHLHEPLNVERLAEVACLSPRQFGRAFHAETGQTPAKAIERLRAEAARARLEAGSESIEQVANAVGFSDPERMRRAFVRVFGQPPQAIRRIARAAGARV
ncbi:GlxA family transcriptional regulator [Melittangium boletus]|uniref:AraC family transcriptional regulator n=1 Tax=Melittangium boletus DSM 14713 TaxID=1294270 RepID=A0A250ICE7_9BACT|nr:helix-turn-helix domain-containing protein [Melittangium boletus]ATB28903.1 AraC family transcriptional regulator [Melittangium boletus DSM 14713]